MSKKVEATNSKAVKATKSTKVAKADKVVKAASTKVEAAKVVSSVKMAGEVKNATLLIKRRLKKEFGLGNAVLKTDAKTAKAIETTTATILNEVATARHNLTPEEVAYVQNHFTNGHFAKYLKVK